VLELERGEAWWQVELEPSDEELAALLVELALCTCECELLLELHGERTTIVVIHTLPCAAMDLEP
jgi:hypothetical protein